MYLSACRKTFFSCRIFHKDWTNSKCLYSRIYLIWHPLDWRDAGLLNIPSVVREYLHWPKLLQVIYSLCFFIQKVVNNPMLYAAIMIPWLIALPSFLIMSSVSGIVHVMTVVVPATSCLLILESVEAILLVQWAQRRPDNKMWKQSISVYTGRFPKPDLLDFVAIFLKCWSIRICGISAPY